MSRIIGWPCKSSNKTISATYSAQFALGFAAMVEMAVASNPVVA